MNFTSYDDDLFFLHILSAIEVREFKPEKQGTL
jgi:hypothetical protein